MIARHFEFPKTGHGLPSFPVSLVYISFHALSMWRDPWKQECQSTDTSANPRYALTVARPAYDVAEI